MTIEKFYGTLKRIETTDEELSIQSSLEAIRDNLNTLVSSPAQPNYQAALANGLKALLESTAHLGELLSSSDREAVRALGGHNFFEPSFGIEVKASIAENAMTPSVARDFVKAKAEQRAEFLENVQTTLQGLHNLNVSGDTTAPGTADAAFLVPRSLFKNHLGDFAKELVFIDRLVQHISEAVDGHATPPELGGLWSSVPTVAVLGGAGVISALATAVNKFLDAWEKVLKIRKMRAELKDMGVGDVAVKQLDEQITETVEEVVEESVELILKGFKKNDQGRRRELESALRRETKRLFGQIERGLAIEFHAAPDGNAGNEDEPTKRALDNVVSISQSIRFPVPEKEPLLLGNGDLLEGDIEVFGVQKTTKTKTRRTKGAAPTDDVQDGA